MSEVQHISEIIPRVIDKMTMQNRGGDVSERKKSQCDKILLHMIEVGKISDLEALRLFGCRRLAARIKDLKNRGYKIRTDIVTNELSGSRYGEYVLEVA